MFLYSYRKNKRFFLLLEVLIAFALVIFCALPLIYPHIELLKSQQMMVSRMELDHTVNLLYGEILEQLYLNRIRWSDIEQKRFKIDSAMLKKLNNGKSLPFQGEYYFREIKHRPSAIGYLNVFEWKLIFEFHSTSYREKLNQEKVEKPLEYSYNVLITRDLRPAIP